MANSTARTKHGRHARSPRKGWALFGVAFGAVVTSAAAILIGCFGLAGGASSAAGLAVADVHIRPGCFVPTAQPRQGAGQLNFIWPGRTDAPGATDWILSYKPTIRRLRDGATTYTWILNPLTTPVSAKYAINLAGGGCRIALLHERQGAPYDMGGGHSTPLLVFVARTKKGEGFAYAHIVASKSGSAAPRPKGTVAKN